jgi:hypothetical protein
MIVTNDPIEREGTDAEPLSVQSPKHGDLEPVIGELQHRLRVLTLERAAIVKRIGIIKKTVVGLADLFGSDVIKGALLDLQPIQSARCSRTHLGLTGLCRQLLREASEPLTVRQILRQLQDKSPGGWDRQRHPENSLRVILRRLVAYGEAEEFRTKEGLCAWKATATVGKLAEESSPTANHKHTSPRWNSLVGSSRTFTKD